MPPSIALLTTNYPLTKNIVYFLNPYIEIFQFAIRISPQILPSKTRPAQQLHIYTKTGVKSSAKFFPNTQQHIITKRAPKNFQQTEKFRVNLMKFF